ncbi:hypothetical protein Tco_0380083, partial [Tanacetum coccineum]
GQYALKLVQFVFGSDAFGSSAQYVDGADDSVQCRYVSGIKISGYGMYFVRTEYQLADMFTKALPEDRFKYLVRRIGMRCLTPAELEVLTNETA